jgi:hypothetical protein
MKQKWNFTIISFFTANYLKEAERLERSCEKFGIPNQIIPSAFGDATQADWRRNTFAKAEFIRSQMARIPGPVVWVDADAEIRRPPILFNELIDYEIAIAAYCRIPGRIRSGTIWMANDPISRGIIDRWVEINILDYMKPGPDMAPQEQKNLMVAIRESHHRDFHILPLAYCRINEYFLDNQAADANEDPVILHFQKSREYRGKR